MHAEDNPRFNTESGTSSSDSSSMSFLVISKVAKRNVIVVLVFSNSQFAKGNFIFNNETLLLTLKQNSLICFAERLAVSNAPCLKA